VQAIVDHHHDVKTATKVRFQEPGATEGKGEKEEKETCDAPSSGGENNDKGRDEPPSSPPPNQPTIKP